MAEKFLTEQERIDHMTMQIENDAVQGSGFIKHPPQQRRAPPPSNRPFYRPGYGRRGGFGRGMDGRGRGGYPRYGHFRPRFDNRDSGWSRHHGPGYSAPPRGHFHHHRPMGPPRGHGGRPFNAGNGHGGRPDSGNVMSGMPFPLPHTGGSFQSQTQNMVPPHFNVYQRQNQSAPRNNQENSQAQSLSQSEIPTN